MYFVFATLRKDLARWRQDATAIALWISIPLMIGGLITALMGGGASPSGVLLIADEDETFLSEFVAGAYGSGELGELLTVEKVSVEAGRERIHAGDASGLLVIPDGFANAFLNNEPVALILETNPAQTILPGIITNVTEVLLDAGFYAHALFGDELGRIANMIDEAPDNSVVAALSVDINTKVTALAPQLFPPVIEVEIVKPAPSDPQPPLALLFLPGIILMAVMFAASGIAGDYWAERENGTLRRLVTAPARLVAFVTGKMLAAMVLIAAVGGLTLAIGFVYHGIGWTKFLSSLLWIATSGAAFFTLFAVLQMLFSTRKAANVASTLILFPLLMAGGSFFPLAVLPEGIAALGRLAPNGFVADRLTTELTADGAWLIDPGSWLLVIATGGIGLAIGAGLLGSRFARG